MIGWNVEEMKKALADAHKAVADLPEPLQSQTFGKMVDRILHEMKMEHPPAEQPYHPPQEQIERPLDSSKSTQAELLQKLNVDAIKLEDFIEVKGQNMRLLFPTKREFDFEETVVFALMHLAVHATLTGQREIESAILRQAMSDKGVPMQNVSTSLKRYPTLIVHKGGKRGSKNTYYRLTTEGYNQAIAILEQVIHDGVQMRNMKIAFLDHDKNSRKHSTASELPKVLHHLLDAGFFNDYRATSEVIPELQKRGVFKERQDVDSYLRKVLLGKRLTREEHGGIWHYKVKE